LKESNILQVQQSYILRYNKSYTCCKVATSQW